MAVVFRAGGEQRQFILLVVILFFSYLAIAVALPVVPVFAHDRLHASNGWSGFAVGALFFATLLTRAQAGKFADQRGGKSCLMSGLRLYAAGSAICLLAAFPNSEAEVRFGLLVSGRVLLGIGEGRVAVGGIVWGIGLMGQARSGKTMGEVARCHGSIAAR